MRIPVDVIITSRQTNNIIDYKDLIMLVMMAGDFDINSTFDLSIFLRTIIISGVQKILVDMGNLTFIESSGIRLLVNIAKLLRSRNGDIAFMNVPDEIEEVFRLINLHRFIKFFKSKQEAINFFRIYV